MDINNKQLTSIIILSMIFYHAKEQSNLTMEI
jgi:hypothetical protein